MLSKKPYYLFLIFTICKGLSYFCAGIHYTFIKIRFLKNPIYISKLSHKKFYTFHCIWHTRFVKRTMSLLVRTPLRKNILRGIQFDISMPKYKGCIIMTCHTPWKRLLTQWCLEKKFALIIGGGKVVQWRVVQRQGVGITELRELVNHLKLGGRVIIIIDAFNKLTNCPVRFLGNRLNASIFAERLAIITKVPILTVVPKLSNTSITFSAGPRFFTEGLKSKSNSITTQIISFFDKEIENNPAIFSNYVG